jgi:hypothetical protein
MDWARILAYVTGTVDQELLARNEYLAAENRILKAQLNGQLKLSDADRMALGEIGHRLGRKVLGDVATVAWPDTILGWYRRLVARKFDASARRGPGRPMKQIARNATMDDCGALRDCRYLLHDRDTKFTRSFRALIASGRVKPLALPARRPNLNAYAERWVRSVKEECLSKVILFGERSLRRALSNYVDHFHAERNHQGKGNVLLFPRAADRQREGPLQCRKRLGGLLSYYHREAA